ncbi:hypothetical protein ACS0TY_016490 [Phlomoides rotata]
MAAGKEVKPAIVYEEFEPFCKWQRNEDHDILEIHLQEFKKEELKVQISNQGILKISGERKLDESKCTKFYKEVPIPINKYDANAIHAKFVNSSLIITIPKLKIPTLQTKEKVSSFETYKIDQAPKKGPTTVERENGGGPSGAKEQTPTPKGVVPTKYRFECWKQKMMDLRMTKMAASLATTFAVIAILAAAYVVYMYKSSFQEIDE